MKKIYNTTVLLFCIFSALSIAIISSKKCNVGVRTQKNIDSITQKNKDSIGYTQGLSPNKNLGGNRFYMHSENWGSKVTTEIAKHMIDISTVELTTIEMNLDEIRTSLMREHQGQLSVDAETLIAQATNYFPHRFANFENSYEQWTVNDDKTCGFWTPCSDSHHTQVKALASYGAIDVDLDIEIDSNETPLPEGSLTLTNQISNVSIGTKNDIKTTIDVPASKRYYKIYLVIRHVVRNSAHQVVGQATNDNRDRIKLEIGSGSQIMIRGLK